MAGGHCDDEGVQRSRREAVPDCRRFADLRRGVDGGGSYLDPFRRRKETSKTSPTTKACGRAAPVGAGIGAATLGASTRAWGSETKSGEATGELRNMAGTGGTDWTSVSVRSASGQSILGGNGALDSFLWHENRMENSRGQAVWSLRTVR